MTDAEKQEEALHKSRRSSELEDQANAVAWLQSGKPQAQEIARKIAGDKYVDTYLNEQPSN